MKKVLLLIITLFISQSKLIGQEEKTIVFPRNEKKEIVYESVIEIDSVNKNELYERARLFIANYYKSAKTVIDYSDKESGQIIIKPVFSAKIKSMGSLYDIGHWNYVFTILVKDNKYKFIIGNFVEKSTSDCMSVGHLESADDNTYALSCPTKRQLRQMVIGLQYDVTSLIQDLNKSMHKKVNDDF